MINGHLSEAKQGFALLDDVDEGTFVRFIRWTYTKDYPAPEYTWAETGEGKGSPDGLKTEAAQREASTSFDFLDNIGSGTKNKKKKKKSSTRLNISLRESFVSQDYVWQTDIIPGDRSNKHPQEDYTEIFLSHARLYVFAEKYDIQPLKILSRQKLQHTLAIYTLYPERVGM